jgi:AraC-like DNA-binding protein
LPLLLVLTFLYFQRNKQRTVDLTNDEEDKALHIYEINESKSTSTVNLNSESLKRKLLHVMLVEKPYLKSDLTIYELAKMLNSNSKYLSVIINTDFNQNFATFINSYRIEEAKELLKEEANEQFTIEAIAKMSGFNSKSSFNNAFKQFQNVTPSQYKNESL